MTISSAGLGTVNTTSTLDGETLAGRVALVTGGTRGIGAAKIGRAHV